MTTARPRKRDNKRLKLLIDFALKEGWAVTRTSVGHLKFTKPGLPPIYTGATPDDLRAGLIARARLRHRPETTTREANANG
ncbi:MULTISPECIES: type II toxin-antitoxin system HicA family toxin [Stutzerimonas]|jgi:hypothetical protein|uniref:Type II toxin-antitoxin system HicA family toxin n=1 Tax=Stutzerimonas stutzeri TaxID=316 RepID=A0AA42TGG6_STUST|nr:MULTISPECIES: type II toxin-antitoxin system HicA family toxin [Stutzerimonas]MDH1237911.1 type II toxin-antitoxin system HicA family toxin [Stutzerimonas stutzeri]MDL2176115.1 type II toxin-antitoxin system HicA family toxin [Stutzerimonas sp. FeSN7]HCF1813042.1 type II toxin-antitoxin system HicA family toxin [Pseudomonas aeruginosa]HCF4448064.1 type II toxin-antitoxin system HicA family toxin [Pseudomonas aeruginosa]